MTWRNRAACTGQPSSVFFPDSGQGADDAAKSVCKSCPVMVECLEYAIVNKIEYGVWGNRTPRERGIRNRAPRVLECHECGDDFEWIPSKGYPEPKCCSPACIRAARSRQVTAYNRQRRAG